MGLRQRANAKKRLAAKVARKAAGVVPSFDTRALRTKTSRRKIHRWTFDLLITREIPEEQPSVTPTVTATAAADTTPIAIDVTAVAEAVTAELAVKPQLVKRTFKFRTDHVLVGTYKDAESTAQSIYEDMSKQHAGELKVIPCAHETVSVDMYRQMVGYQEMNNILQLAYELAITDLVAKTSLALPGDDQHVDEIRELKNSYYKRALDTLRPKPRVEPIVDLAQEQEHEKVDLEALQAVAYNMPTDDLAISTIP